MSVFISSLPLLSFPPRNENVLAKWMPVYIEPMVGSGERICIAVATVNDSGSLVVPVVALDRLSCLYGKDADAILLAKDLVTNDLRNILMKEGIDGLGHWTPPMEGIYSGRIADGAGSSLEEIVRTGLTMCASLVERLVDTEDETNLNSSGISGNRLERLVKEKVLSIRPELENMFGRQRKLGENVRSVTIGFVGNTIAANFGVLMPHLLARNVKDIKAKLWDLAQLREDFGQPQLFVSTTSRFEMLVFRPTNDAPEYSDRQMRNINEAVNELEAEADKKKIHCRSCNTDDEIVEVLLDAEAA